MWQRLHVGARRLDWGTNGQSVLAAINQDLTHLSIRFDIVDLALNKRHRMTVLPPEGFVALSVWNNKGPKVSNQKDKYRDGIMGLLL